MSDIYQRFKTDNTIIVVTELQEKSKMESNAKNSIQQTEVDIKELILTIWRGKWLIIFTTLVSALLGVVFIFLFQTKNALYEIEQIDSFQIDEYKELNYLLRQAQLSFIPLEQRASLIELKNDPSITAELLKDLMIERIRSRQDFMEVAKQLPYIAKSSQNESEWNKQIKEFVYQIQLLPGLTPEELISNKSLNARKNWQIKTIGIKNSDLYTQFLDAVLLKANEHVRITLLNKIQKEISVLRLKQQQDIEDINLKIEGLRDDYKDKLASRVAKLKEQIQIARKLGIDKNTLDVQSAVGAGSLITAIQFEPPLYFRGYIALEEELLLLTNRKDIDVFIPELAELVQTKRALETEQLVDRLNKALEISNLNNSKAFASVLIDSNAIEFTASPSHVIVILVSILLGLILSIIGLFVSNIIRETLSDSQNKKL